jgi:DNA integrity scanning protein DisA with diadenylate cyclase activity
MDLDQQTVRIIKDYMVDNRNARNRIQEQLDYLKTIGLDIDLNARDYSKQ